MCMKSETPKKISNKMQTVLPQCVIRTLAFSFKIIMQKLATLAKDDAGVLSFDDRSHQYTFLKVPSRLTCISPTLLCSSQTFLHPPSLSRLSILMKKVAKRAGEGTTRSSSSQFVLAGRPFGVLKHISNKVRTIHYSLRNHVLENFIEIMRDVMQQRISLIQNVAITKIISITTRSSSGAHAARDYSCDFKIHP